MQSFLNQHKKKLLIIALLFALAIILLPHAVFAQAASSSTAAANSSDYGLSKAMIQAMNFLKGIFWPILMMIGALLQNDLLFGGGMEQTLLNIWVQVRNIVNIFFVLILVGIALYNVVGGFQQDYHIKAVLPKFIIGLILVNFSFLGVKIVLDGVNVITTGIFALPASIGGKLDEAELGKNFCMALYGPKKDYHQRVLDAIKAAKNPKSVLCTDDAENPAIIKDDSGEQDLNNYFNTVTRRNAALVLALNFQNAHLLDQVPEYPEKDANVTKLMLGAMFSIALYIIYASAFVALFAVLLVRLILMWLLIVLSPLVVLLYVLPEKIKGMLKGSGEDVGQVFIKHAIVPIQVAIPMAIGIILLDGLKKGIFPQIELKSAVGLNILTSGTSTLQNLIGALATAAFIWIGVFDAMKDTKAHMITDGIKDYVGGFGKFMAKLPLITPLIPLDTGGGKRISLMALGASAKSLFSMPENVAIEQAREQGMIYGSNPDQLGKNLGNATGINQLKDFGRQDRLGRLKKPAQDGVVQYSKTHHDWEPPKGMDRSTFINELKKPGDHEELMKKFWAANGVTEEEGGMGGGAGVAGATGAAALSDQQKKTAADADSRLTNERLALLQDQSKVDKIPDKAQQDAIKKLQTAMTDPKDQKAAIEKAFKDKNLEPALKALEKVDADEQAAAATQKSLSSFSTEIQLIGRNGKDSADKAAKVSEAVKKAAGGQALDPAKIAQMHASITSSITQDADVEALKKAAAADPNLAAILAYTPPAAKPDPKAPKK